MYMQYMYIYKENIWGTYRIGVVVKIWGLDSKASSAALTVTLQYPKP